jgi:hypothetical protein
MNERFGAGFLRLLSEVSQEKLHCSSKASCEALGNELSNLKAGDTSEWKFFQTLVKLQVLNSYAAPE